MKKILLVSICFLAAEESFILTDMAPPELKSKKIAWAASGLSLVPGLGQFYLGDYQAAGGYAATALGLLMVPDSISSQVLFINTSLYNMYAAYRDARMYNGLAHYKYPVPTDTMYELATAPFRPSVIAKPEVWGGYLGCLAVAMSWGMATSYLDAGQKIEMVHPIMAFPIGIGEEAYFRGVWMTGLSEVFGETTGLLASSVLFALAHAGRVEGASREEKIAYYTKAMPLIAGLGAYLGWVTRKNNSLQEAATIHAWYDFTLLGLFKLAQWMGISEQLESDSQPVEMKLRLSF